MDTPSLWARSRLQTGCRWSLRRESPAAALQRPAGNSSAPRRWSALTSGGTMSAGDVKTQLGNNCLRGKYVIYTKTYKKLWKWSHADAQYYYHYTQKYSSTIEFSMRRAPAVTHVTAAMALGYTWDYFHENKSRPLNVSVLTVHLQPSVNHHWFQLYSEIVMSVPLSQELYWMPFLSSLPQLAHFHTQKTPC